MNRAETNRLVLDRLQLSTASSSSKKMEHALRGSQNFNFWNYSKNIQVHLNAYLRFLWDHFHDKRMRVIFKIIFYCSKVRDWYQCFLEFSRKVQNSRLKLVIFYFGFYPWVFSDSFWLIWIIFSQFFRFQASNKIHHVFRNDLRFCPKTDNWKGINRFHIFSYREFYAIHVYIYTFHNLKNEFFVQKLIIQSNI